MTPSQHPRPTASEVAAMSEATIRAYKDYYTRLLFGRLFPMMAAMGIGTMAPLLADPWSPWQWVALACGLLSPFLGIAFGVALRQSVDFDKHLNAIGKGPFQRRGS